MTHDLRVMIIVYHLHVYCTDTQLHVTETTINSCACPQTYHSKVTFSRSNTKSCWNFLEIWWT